MSRSGFLFFVALSALSTVSATTLSACSSGDVAVGSSSQELKKKANGAPTGDGHTCSWDDAVSHDSATGATTTTPAANGPYKVGDTFKSPDSCNDCSCTAQGITCTAQACAPGGGGSCTYGGKTYASGATFRSTDGCNGCGCQNGAVSCTELACAPAPACKKTGCSGEICSDQDIASTCEFKASYACYQTATCEPQGNGQCGFTPTAALTQCLASK